MKPGLRILLDCDGVLGDFHGSLLAQLQRVFPHLGPYPEHPPQEWSIAAWLTPEQHAAAIHILDATPFAAGMRPLAGAIEAYEYMRERAHGGVYIVTSPWVDNPSWESDRRMWLKAHFGIDEDHIVSTTAKFLVGGDVLVDDRPKHVAQWSAAHGKRAVLVGHAHNADVEHADRIEGWTAGAAELVVHVAQANRAER